MDLSADAIRYIPIGFAVASYIPAVIIFYSLLAYLGCKGLTKKQNKVVPAFVTGICRVVLRGVVGVKRLGPGPHDKEYTLFSYPAPPALVNVLGLHAMSMLNAGLIGFWNGFFEIETYYRCSVQLFAGFTQTILSDNPCSTGDESLVTNFTFNYFRGISFAGGILALMLIFFNGKTTFVMWLLVKKNRAKTVKTRRAWTAAVIINGIIIITLVIILTFALLYLKVLSPDLFLRRGLNLQYFQVVGFSGVFVTNIMLFSVVLPYYNWNIGKKESGPADIELGELSSFGLQSEEAESSLPAKKD